MRLPAPQPLFALLLALAPALQAPRLVAAEPTPSELSVARRLFDEGRAAEDAARWSEAADKFRRATAIKDTPGLRFHLARCQEELGAFVEALVEYDRARELIDSGVRAADVEKLLAEARERVRAKVAQLTLRLPSDVQNVSVELDGKALSASVLGVPMPINPGKHQVSAVAVGRARFSSELTLGTGEVRQLSIELPIASAASKAPASTPTSTPAAQAARVDDTTVPTRTIVLIGEASLFAAALGTGIVFSVARSSANERYQRANATVLRQLNEGDDPDRACSKPLEGCTELSDAGNDRTQAGRIAAGGFIAAGVSAAAFGLTYFLWPRSDAPVAVGATARSGGLSLAVSGRF
jgi:hypothetical protein